MHLNEYLYMHVYIAGVLFSIHCNEANVDLEDWIFLLVSLYLEIV
jgi:hypothetical protein